MVEENAVAFACEGAWLYGVISVPQAAGERGVLVVVGGPQYRVGSHRQFTLLARSLAQQGISCMRFDYRGMGDSEGKMRPFDSVDADLRAAIDQFFKTAPSLKSVVLWGLCDGAAAAVFYASKDERISGLALLNPWVRTDGGVAKATLKHYYPRRLLDPGLWEKILHGRFDYSAATSSAWRLLRTALIAAPELPGSLPDRMYAGLSRYRGKVLIVLSGADLTAQEFSALAAGSDKWQRMLAAPGVKVERLAGADHTCSRRVWLDQVAHWTTEWIGSW